MGWGVLNGGEGGGWEGEGGSIEHSGYDLQYPFGETHENISFLIEYSPYILLIETLKFTGSD